MNILSNCKNYILSIVLLSPFLISGCIQDDYSVCNSSNSVQLEIRAHWSNPDSIPGGIRAILYSGSNNEYIKKDFPPAGGTIKVPEGTYSVLVLNNDSQKILYNNESSYTYYSAYTPSTSVVFPNRPDITQIFSSPDHLWLESYKSYDIVSGLNVIDVYPKNQVYQYYVVVMIEGMEYIKSAGGTVTGLYKSIFLHDFGLSPTVGSVYLEPSAHDGGIIFAFRSFGVVIENADGILKHDITFLLNTNTKTYLYNIDITEPLDSIRYGGTIYLRERIVVDPEEPAEEGFNASAEDWNTTAVPVPVEGEE